MKEKLVVVFVIFFISISAMAQKFISPIKPSLFVFHYSLIDYKSPAQIDSSSLMDVFNQGDIFKPKKQNSVISLSYWKGINRFLDISGKFNLIFYDFALNNTAEKFNDKFGTEMEGSINAHPIGDDHFLTPFITTGIGAGHYTNKVGAYIPIGIGFQFNINSKFYLLLQTQYRSSLSKNIFSNNLFHSLGIGINTKKYKTPKPTIPPVMEIKDHDGDGIVDSLDSCPETTGTLALQGCPDLDADGIADKYDRCPNTTGIAKYHGCPIPDIDQDGINDAEDKCPNEAGPLSSFGCPLIDKMIAEKINNSAKNIFFVTGSAKLLAKSYNSLETVAQIMKSYPSYMLEVNGHTDNTGSTASNKKLSENRAEEVKKYLVGVGVAESRIIASGYGEGLPIGDNSSLEGRAENRRVEMHLINY